MVLYHLSTHCSRYNSGVDGGAACSLQTAAALSYRDHVTRAIDHVIRTRDHVVPLYKEHVVMVLQSCRVGNKPSIIIWILWIYKFVT